MTGDPLSRVRITSPRTAAARQRPRGGRSNAAEIDALTSLGEVYVRSLMRAQLRLAGYVVLLLTASLGVLPIALRLASVNPPRLLGVPLPWLVLGVGVYPWLLALAWWYVHRAERNEAAFDDLLGQANDPSDESSESLP